MSASSDIFAHVKLGHADLAQPSSAVGVADAIGWIYNAENFKPEVTKNGTALDQEKLHTLGIYTKFDRRIFAREFSIAQALSNSVEVDYLQRYGWTSIGEKGQGRKDAKDLMGRVTQSISIPTTMQKIRRIFSNRGEKEVEERSQEDADA